MRDDPARLKRIEHEQARTDRQRAKTDTAREAAGWIRDLLEGGLGRAEIKRVADLLPLTSLGHLINALHASGGDPSSSTER
jgi:hypothetical protein